MHQPKSNELDSILFEIEDALVGGYRHTIDTIANNLGVDRGVMSARLLELLKDDVISKTDISWDNI